MDRNDLNEVEEEYADTMTNDRFVEILSSGKKVIAGSQTHIKMHRLSKEAREITVKLNNEYHSEHEIRQLFSALTEKEVDDSFILFPPFFTDCGKNISVGKNVFINSGCCFQDQGGLEIGDECMIGQQVVIATLNHSPLPQERKDMLPAKVTIGKNVWIGAHATILPGVCIGDNAIVGAGAVVTRDVPEGAVAAGVPAKIIKYVR